MTGQDAKKVTLTTHDFAMALTRVYVDTESWGRMQGDARGAEIPGPSPGDSRG
jgi:hypothetical protein